MTALPATTYRPVPVPAPLSVLPLHEYHPGQHDRAGLLPVVPRFAPYGSVRWLEDFARATGWPVLGALALDGRSRRRSRSGREREVAA
jgi:hypothetical protein